MEVQLKFYSPLSIAITALNMSHDSHDKSDKYNGPTDNITDKDKKRLDRVVNKLKHGSILEMLTYTYDVHMSTKTLLAFTRHRVGISLTMRSTRYTTKKNRGKHEVQATPTTEPYLSRIMAIVDEALSTGMSSDEASLLLPQAYLYRGQLQFNARSLQHFLKLRTAPDAHFQIRQLAYDLYNSLPSEHKYLFTDSVYPL